MGVELAGANNVLVDDIKQLRVTLIEADVFVI